MVVYYFRYSVIIYRYNYVHSVCQVRYNNMDQRGDVNYCVDFFSFIFPISDKIYI